MVGLSSSTMTGDEEREKGGTGVCFAEKKGDEGGEVKEATGDLIECLQSRFKYNLNNRRKCKKTK